MIKSTFSKIGLKDLKPEIGLLSQITPMEFDLVEEQYNEEGDFIRAIEKKVKLRNQWAHVDVLKIFNKLRPHMALLCEINAIEPDIEDPMAVLDPDDISPAIYVKSIMLTGGDENLRVTMVGFKTLAHENTLDLKSPTLRLDEMDYPFIEQLVDLISELEVEARKAIYEQKGCGQLNLFQDEPGEAPRPKTKRKALNDFAEDLVASGASVTISHGKKTVSFP